MSRGRRRRRSARSPLRAGRSAATETMPMYESIGKPSLPPAALPAAAMMPQGAPVSTTAIAKCGTSAIDEDREGRGDRPPPADAGAWGRPRPPPPQCPRARQARRSGDRTPGLRSGPARRRMDRSRAGPRTCRHVSTARNKQEHEGRGHIGQKARALDLQWRREPRAPRPRRFPRPGLRVVLAAHQPATTTPTPDEGTNEALRPLRARDERLWDETEHREPGRAGAGPIRWPEHRSASDAVSCA